MVYDKQKVKGLKSSVCLNWSRLNRKNMSNYTFCVIIVNGPTAEHFFDDIASSRWYQNMSSHELCFEAMNILLVFFVEFLMLVLKMVMPVLGKSQKRTGHSGRYVNRMTVTGTRITCRCHVWKWVQENDLNKIRIRGTGRHAHRKTSLAYTSGSKKESFLWFCQTPL